MKTPSAATAICISVFVLLLSGCADTARTAADNSGGAYQVVNVNTPGMTGANCVLRSGRDTYSVKAPGSVTVRRAPDRMDVSCFKGDHMHGREIVTPSFAPREAQQAEMDHTACTTCTYPSTVTVAMSLNGNAMDVKVTQFH
ncbi:MAG: hypothetical protein PW788_00980 [Micavibrio sp.]|nr:hypothetical protein [Micavibrio sp.]